MPDNVAEAPIFTDTIVIPEDGDDVDQASVLQVFQGLTNRTRYLKTAVDAIPRFSDGDWLYTTNGVPTRREKTSLLALESGQIEPGQEGFGGNVTRGEDSRQMQFTPEVGWQWLLPLAILTVPIRLPPGCLITRLRVGVDNQGTNGGPSLGDGVRSRLVAVQHDYSLGGPNAVYYQPYFYYSGNNVGVASWVHPGFEIQETQSYYLQIGGGYGNAFNYFGRAFWARVDFLDPGPQSRG